MATMRIFQFIYDIFDALIKYNNNNNNNNKKKKKKKKKRMCNIFTTAGNITFYL
jgi:hypothetical protein